MELATFRLTGHRSPEASDETVAGDLVPALFAAYRDLTKLRYDYPLVLAEGNDEGTWIRPLRRIVDDVLCDIAPQGIEGERLRRHVLRLEEAMRSAVADGYRGSLSGLWEQASADVCAGAEGTDGETLGEDLGRARAALSFAGRVVDCDETTPLDVVTHAWSLDHESRRRGFQAKVGDLVRRLRDFLRADDLKSEAARAPEVLGRTFGKTFETAFDFQAMSKMLHRDGTTDALPAVRRQRIETTLATLEGQRFFALEGDEDGEADAERLYGAVFDSCAGALQALRERFADMAAVIKAIEIAEMEVLNRYREDKHDPIFDVFDADSLTARDLALFPPLLVRLRADALDSAEKAAVIEVLSSALPIKVAVQNDDILAIPKRTGRGFAFGAEGWDLARMALGLNGVFVLQAAADRIYAHCESILHACTTDCPALFHLFSGAGGHRVALPQDRPPLAPYLVAAAATESRAFPTFALDPTAGEDWASRFWIEANPQPTADWPAHDVAYEDDDLQRQSERADFTFVDYVAADPHQTHHFVVAPKDQWEESMLPASAVLDLPAEEADGAIPYLLMIDENNRLYRVVVENGVLEAARRCRTAWRDLQELGGINNSHARLLVAREREAWEEEKERELAELRQASAPQPEAAKPEGAAEESVAAEVAEGPAPAEPPSDDPSIETMRCTTCNECTNLNNRMFAYNDNQQAYIADPDAGTYREMVEAAEACQVAIIHPGKPRNPDEANLDELIKRAELFL